MTEEKQFDIESCMEPPPDTKTITVNNPAGVTVFEVTLKSPTWGEWRRTVLTASKIVDDHVLAEAHSVILCVANWSAPLPVTAENLLLLHPALQTMLAQEALALLIIKQGQIKNFASPSPHSSTPPNSAMAEA